MKYLKSQSGMLLTTVLLVGVSFTFIALAVVQFSLVHYTSSRRSMVALSALSVAEAGGDNFMYNLNQDSNYSGTGGEFTFFSDSVKGKGTYETTVTNGSLNNEKIIISTGRVYLPANASRPLVTRKIKLIVRGSEPFSYAVQSGGNGPIYFYGSPNIDNAKIFTNKFIVMQNSGGGISLTRDDIRAADYDHDPSLSTWKCSIDGNSSIHSGTVSAAFNVNNAHCGIDTSGATLSQNDASVVPQPLPTVDKSSILAGISTNLACTDITSTLHLKQANYPDQTGSPNPCNVSLGSNTYTVDDNVYIRGNLTINKSTLVPAATLTHDVYVIVDGTINVPNNNTSITTNANGAAITFVSYSPIDSNGDKNAANAIEIGGSSGVSLGARFLALSGSLGHGGKGSIGPVAALDIVFKGSGSINFLQLTGVPTNSSGWYVQYYEQL